MNEKIRLNPFVYISETDIRFYLLVLIGIIMPALFAFLFAIIILNVGVGSENTLFLRLLIAVPIIFFIPLLIYLKYKRYPNKIIKESKLKEFNKERFPEHFDYIEKLHEKFLISEKKSTLMYQPFDTSLSAFTFGTKNTVHISISGGLIKKFRDNIDSFRSIILHEMGHVANEDIEKTYMADSTFRSLLWTLSIPFGIFLLYLIFLILQILYLAIILGLDINSIITQMDPGKSLLIIMGLASFFILFLGIIYILRNQIIRLREFYADARVLEWEKSSDGLVKTLEGSGGKHYSDYAILTKFHPNIKERIQMLNSNLDLFHPSLWVAFSTGFFYLLIETYLPFFQSAIFSDLFWKTDKGGLEFAPTLLRGSISIFIFTFLMLAISSGFHKLILKDKFIGNAGYLSITKLSNVIKFSLTFSFGWIAFALLDFPTVFHREDVNLLADFLSLFIPWLYHSLYFAMTLIFLLIFAEMLILRSFSKKEADTNFLLITVLSSTLYILIRFVAIETVNNKLLAFVFFIVFSIAVYIFIINKDKKLYCPGCGKKVETSEFKLNCQNCQRGLYSWAIHST